MLYTSPSVIVEPRIGSSTVASNRVINRNSGRMTAGKGRPRLLGSTVDTTVKRFQFATRNRRCPKERSEGEIPDPLPNDSEESYNNEDAYWERCDQYPDCENDAYILQLHEEHYNAVHARQTIDETVAS